MTAVQTGTGPGLGNQVRTSRAEQWPTPDTPDHVGRDPFFDAPSGFETAPEGTLLRYRDVRIGFLGRVRQKVRATQLLYRTVNMHGEPEVTATTVFSPLRGAKAGAPLVSYQCAIDSLHPKTFPSYVLQHGVKTEDASFPQIEYLFIAAAVARGWTVSVPDHGGQTGRWGIPREPGYMVLDGLRAALQHQPLGLDETTPIGLWGYSGGGLATSWAAETAPSYAPELNLIAGAVGAPVSDPGNVFVFLNNTLFTGLPTLVIAALAREYPTLREVLAEHVNDTGRKVFYQDALDWSPERAIRKMAHKDFGYYCEGLSFEEVAKLPKLLDIFDDIRPGQSAPTVPMLMVQSTKDQISPESDAVAHVQRYVAGGAHVQYLTDDWSDHFSMHFLSSPLLLGWLADRFDGKPLAPAGHRHRRSIMASPRQIALTVRMIGTLARIAVGRRV
ncbi:lipase family protein [Tsukamurella serpentis]